MYCPIWDVLMTDPVIAEYVLPLPTYLLTLAGPCPTNPISIPAYYSGRYPYSMHCCLSLA